MDNNYPLNAGILLNRGKSDQLRRRGEQVINNVIPKTDSVEEGVFRWNGQGEIVKLNWVISEELIVGHFFSFRCFIVTGAGIAYHRHFAFGKQNTCYICDFTDEKGRKQYETKCSEQRISGLRKRVGNA